MMLKTCSFVCSRNLCRTWNLVSPSRFSSPHALATTRATTWPVTVTGPIQFFSTRRRRVRGDSESMDQDELMGNKDKVTHLNTFVLASQTCLEKIERSLEHMKKHNDVFLVERHAEFLKLTVAEGEYRFEVDESSCTITMQSPVSGKFIYYLNESSGDWVSVQDGHIMEGMFVRDLIRQCNGVPKL